MIDLETMSTKPNAAIIQIGACTFDGQAAGIRVDLQSCVDAGLAVDASTIMWWMQQSDAARASVTSPGASPLRQALEQFTAGLAALGLGSAGEVWSYPASFDIVILESAYRAVGLLVPWKYNAVRCLRTLAALRPDIARVKPALAHDAVSDATAQAAWAKACLEGLPC